MKLKTVVIIVVGIIILAAIGFVGLLFYNRYRLNHLENKRNLQTHVDKAGEKYVGKSGNVGLVIGVVKDDKVYIKGFGKKAKERNEAPDAKTIFELASIGKTFTASAAQILADRGEISFDDAIDKYANGKFKLCEQAKDVTLRHLATHTSGFPSLPTNLEAKISDELNPYRDYRVEDLYDYLATCEGKSEIGTFDYSNLGMGVLGHILETKTGKPYEQIVKDEITSKLGMENTTITLNEEQRKLLAQGYNAQGNPNPVWEDRVLTAAGSFLSNAEDMTKFIKANLDENQSDISNSLLRTHEKQFNGETGLAWQIPGWIEFFLAGSRDFVWHNGQAGGYSSFIAIDRARKCGLILLSNTTGDVTATGLMLLPFVRQISLAEDNQKQ